MVKQKNTINKIWQIFIFILLLAVTMRGALAEWYNISSFNATFNVTHVPRGIASNASHLFWIDNNNDKIHYTTIAGATGADYKNKSTALWGLSGVTGIEVNVTGTQEINGSLDANGTMIYLVDNTVTNVTVINQTWDQSISWDYSGLTPRTFEDVTKIGEYLYYLNDLDRYIWRSNLSGGNFIRGGYLELVGTSTLRGMCSNGSKLYIIDDVSDVMMEYNFDGSYVSTFLNLSRFGNDDPFSCTFINDSSVAVTEQDGYIFIYSADTITPVLSNAQSNQTAIEAGDEVKFQVTVKDNEAGLSTAWLYTNESGKWVKHIDGTYGSPRNLSNLSRLTDHQINFTFRNCMVRDTYANASLNWYVNVSDTSGNYNWTNKSNTNQTLMPFVVTTAATTLNASNSTCRNKNNLTIYFDGNVTNTKISIKLPMYDYNITYRSCPFKADFGDRIRNVNLSAEGNDTRLIGLGYCNVTVVDADVDLGDGLTIEYDPSIRQVVPSNIPKAIAVTIMTIIIIIYTFTTRRTSGG